MDLVFVAAGLGEVIRSLKAEPEFGGGPTSFFEADGHFGRDGGVPVEQAREGMAGDAEDLSRFGHAQVEGIQAILLESWSRMRGILHGHDRRPSYSVIIDEVDTVDVTFFQAENDAPVARDANAPIAFPSASQPVEPQTR